MTQQMLNSIILAVISCVLSFFSATFWFKKNAAVKEAERLAIDHKRLEDRVQEMERQLGVVGATILPISAAFQAILVKELTHFHTPEMDALLVKLGPPLVLTEDEEVDLIQALKDREVDVDDQVSDSERDAAHMLPLVMKRVRLDLVASTKTHTEMQLVTIRTEEQS